jgi:ubiquinone/menaquinone biosynthesis C-methylase UbiE
MASGYQFLPEVYDRWQQTYGKDFSTLILPKLLRSIKAHKIPTSSLLDLACGTGTLAVMMAKRGWKVFGVDASKGMLREGKKKIKGTPYSVVFSHQNMERFVLREQVTLAVCMFDAVNHLTSSKALLNCFRRVNSTLIPGGYFIFDANNELCYETIWRQTEVIHEEDFTMALENTFDAPTRIGRSRVTLFMRRGGLFERRVETVRERYYPRDEIGELLRRAGFQVLESADFNFTPNRLVGEIKTWWVARK